MTRAQRAARNQAIVESARQEIMQLIAQYQGTKRMTLALESAPKWYSDAQAFARYISRSYNISVEAACGIIAAFSIQTRWHKNKQHVLAFLDGTQIDGGFKLRIKKARKILTYDVACRLRGLAPQMQEIERILNGKKITRFARTIYNHLSTCIVIDTWMLKAMSVHDHYLKWVDVYELLEEMLLELAASFYMTPSKFQAFVWVLKRGKAF